MRFISFQTKQYLAAAIFASLLQGVVTAAPVFAETIATSETTVAQETTTPETTATQEPMQSKAPATADKTVVPPGMAEQNEIDHSAEFKPIQNEFLKEGEGIPGSEVPYQSERSLSGEEWKTIDRLEKDIRILQRERQEFFKNRAKENEEKEKAFTDAFKGRQEYSIVFNPEDYTTKTMDANGERVTFRAYENLVYVKKPYDPESQMLSVYIPEAYLKGETINGFTAETAPIFMPNGVGGYMPGQIEEPREDSRHGGANAALYALSNGYVVVSPAIRGRSLKHNNGYETGKAPALIVDYKAAVRFVRHNRKAGRIPAGDTEKIISSGTSAGGALSALLGATGNAKDYDPYLKEIGAAKERDDIFASMAYCPITNLENADMAYEWMFHNANEYYNAGPARRMAPAENNALPAGNVSPDGNVQDRPANAPAEAAKGTAITPEQKEISAELKEKFTEYLNGLNLRDSLGNRLNLAPDGYGLFREYIESLYLESAQNAIDTGEDVSKTPWITVSEGTAVHMDFDKYVATVKRLKGVPAFDAFDMRTGENNEFGTYDITNKHFTRYALEHSQLVTVPKLEEEKEIAEEKARKYSVASPVEKRQLRKANLEEQMEKDKLDLAQYMANGLVIKMMNPMRYIGNPDVQTAPNWRIRHGALDRDTALAIPAMLAVKLKNNDKAVDFKVTWGYGHAGDYDLPELFAWTDRICKIKDKADAIIKEEQKKKSEETETATPAKDTTVENAQEENATVDTTEDTAVVKVKADDAAKETTTM